MLLRSLLLLGAAVLLLSACENLFDDTSEYDEAVAMVDSVHVDTIRSLTATVSFLCYTPTPCWSFSRTAETRTGNDIAVTVYRRVKRNITCVQMTGSFRRSVDFTVPAPGRYTLKFYRTTTTTLDTTITF